MRTNRNPNQPCVIIAFITGMLTGVLTSSIIKTIAGTKGTGITLMERGVGTFIRTSETAPHRQW